MTEVADEQDVLSGWGFRARLSGSWEGRLYLRRTPDASFADPGGRAAPSGTSPGADGWSGERPAPVLHLGNFPLPGSRGDFGSGAVGLMAQRHAFVALLEFGAPEAGTALFAPVTGPTTATGLPRPRLAEFGSGTLQRRLPGQLGYQRFFTLAGRPLCLFVVLGSAARATALVGAVADVLDEVEVG